MADPVAQPTGDGGQAPAPQPDSESPPKYVTAELLNDTLSKFASDTKAAIGRLAKTVEGLQVPQPQPKDEEDEPVESDADTPSIKAARAKLRRKESALMKQAEVTRLAAIRNTINAKLHTSGVNPALLNIATDGIIARNRDKIIVETDEFGDQSFMINSGTETSMLSDFLDEYLKSDLGKALLLPKNPPNLPTIGGVVKSGRIKITTAEANSGRISPKDLASGKYEIEG